MGINDVRHFFKENIGEGRRFANQTEMARFLGLKVTTATKLYTFLKGADTQSSAVIDWIERLGGKVLLPTAQREDGTGGEAGDGGEVARLQRELAQKQKDIETLTTEKELLRTVIRDISGKNMPIENDRQKKSCA